MYIIDHRTMLRGDIVLTRQNTPQSRFIQNTISSNYSHVLLHVGDGSYMHADKDGVHSYNVQRLLLQNEDDAIVLRLKDSKNITSENWLEICNSTHKDVGVGYAYIKALQAGINKKLNFAAFTNNSESRLQYCSLLIQTAYKCAGIDLCPSTSLCTPDDIETSPLLYTISTPVRLATESEIEFANDKDLDKISHQTKATNYIFKKARATISRHIHGFDELFQTAAQDRSWDNKISKIIESSGYLKMPELEQRDCPWRYDHASFERLGLKEPERFKLIIKELTGADRQVEKYEKSVKNYDEQYRKLKLKSLKSVLRAYRSMLEISYNRQILFKNLLRGYHS